MASGLSRCSQSGSATNQPESFVRLREDTTIATKGTKNTKNEDPKNAVRRPRQAAARGGKGANTNHSWNASRFVFASLPPRVSACDARRGRTACELCDLCDLCG